MSKNIMTILKLQNKAIFAILCSITVLGCGQQTKLDSSDSSELKTIYGSIQQQERQNALILMTRYFGGEFEVKEVSSGPAGAIQISAENISTRNLHSFFMLPDQQHLIKGELYSPHMTSAQITRQHSQVMKSRAVMNEKLDKSKSALRKKISNAIKTNKTTDQIIKVTQQAVQQRVEDSVEAKRDHNKNVIRSMTPSVNSINTASLPRNNTVIDKNSLYERIENSNWISDGDSKKILYVFYDFRCSACSVVHKYLQPHIKNNELQVRYIPVGALGEESLISASLSLIPETNDERLKMMNKLSEPGSLKELLKLNQSQDEKKRGHKAAMSNFKLLLENKRIATPTFAYRTITGAQIAVLTSKKQLVEVINNIEEI